MFGPQKQRVIILDDITKKCDEIRSRHVERDKPWEVLEKTTPGYFVSRARMRRKVQEDYCLWASNLWKQKLNVEDKLEQTHVQ